MSITKVDLAHQSMGILPSAQVPQATTSALGGVKVDGTTITINAGTGVITATAAGSTINFADNETPAGTIDGTNATFTLAHTPIVSPSSSLLLFLNGVLQKASVNDYTLTGASIVFATAPVVNSIILAFYRF